MCLWSLLGMAVLSAQFCFLQALEASVCASRPPSMRVVRFFSATLFVSSSALSRSSPSFHPGPQQLFADTEMVFLELESLFNRCSQSSVFSSNFYSLRTTRLLPASPSIFHNHCFAKVRLSSANLATDTENISLVRPETNENINPRIRRHHFLSSSRGVGDLKTNKAPICFG